MAHWRYLAADSASRTVSGDLEAADEASVVDQLHAAGLVPLRIRPTNDAASLSGTVPSTRSRARRLTTRSLAIAVGQIATLLQAGLALDEAIEVSAGLVEKSRTKDIMGALVEQIRSGSSLGNAMATLPGAFPDFAIGMVRAGEAGGGLQQALARLAEFLERTETSREHLKSALVYPAVVALMCFGSIAVLFAFVVPRFRPLFEQAGDALPASAQALLAASDLLSDYWWTLLLAALLITLLIHRGLRDPALWRSWNRLILRLPLLGSLVAKVETVHFSRTLGTLLTNGVTLVSALSITRETIGNPVFADAAGAALEQIRTGKGLTETLRKTGVFPPLALRLIRTGEESGRQDEMLLRVADVLEVETRRTIDRLLSLLTPALTIVLGIIVAAVIGSILTAVLSVYELAL